ncbi:MAG: hypothetical protein MK345_04680 [SAR202 cluster bacterium]|nr:hypothetical protein [SAR202 cluster bacterium]
MINYKIKLFYFCLLFLISVYPSLASLHADGISNIKLESHEIENQFPMGFNVDLNVTSNSDVTDISMNVWKGENDIGIYKYFEFEQSEKVMTSLFWYTNSSQTYIPPGTTIKYQFKITNQLGDEFLSEMFEFVYYDINFNWDFIEDDGFVVYYHGPMKGRATKILEAIQATATKMQPVFGEYVESPIAVTVYNNPVEMIVGLPPESKTIRRELITQGMAFNSIGTILVLASSSDYLGTASHEMTHILVHRSTDGIVSVPSWLHEGLAEYANIYPSFSFTNALDMAIMNDDLLPLTMFSGQPGTSEDKLLFYGQAESFINFLISEFGVDKMKELLATIKTSTNLDSAIQQTYGQSKVQLENLWRTELGVSLYIQTSESSVPTPKPFPTISLYSLTPQAGSSEIKNTYQSDVPTTKITNDSLESSNASCNAKPNQFNSDNLIVLSGAIVLLLFCLSRKHKDY